VPSDLKLSGPKETLTATVSYDTLDLYGKVDAAVPITIEAKD
jgi:hypothetical protein